MSGRDQHAAQSTSNPFLHISYYYHPQNVLLGKKKTRILVSAGDFSPRGFFLLQYPSAVAVASICEPSSSSFLPLCFAEGGNQDLPLLQTGGRLCNIHGAVLPKWRERQENGTLMSQLYCGRTDNPRFLSALAGFSVEKEMSHIGMSFFVSRENYLRDKKLYNREQRGARTKTHPTLFP